jgi:hypothetical protein
LRLPPAVRLSVVRRGAAGRVDAESPSALDAAPLPCARAAAGKDAARPTGRLRATA